MPHGLRLGFAYREGAVAVLPMKAPELGELTMDPARRVRLDRPQNLGDGLVLPEPSQEMNMVSDAVGQQTKATLTANGATQVFPEPGA